MGQIALSFLASHQQYFYGVALGILLSNPGTLATLAFNAFVKIPGVGAWIAAHPDDAKKWADGFDAAIDKAIDAHAAKAPSVPPPAP